MDFWDHAYRSNRRSSSHTTMEPPPDGGYFVMGTRCPEVKEDNGALTAGFVVLALVCLSLGWLICLQRHGLFLILGKIWTRVSGISRSSMASQEKPMTDEARANQCADSIPRMQEPKLAPVLGFPLGYLPATLALSSVPVPGIYPPLPSYDSACPGGAELTMTQVYSTPQTSIRPMCSVPAMPENVWPGCLVSPADLRTPTTMPTNKMEDTIPMAVSPGEEISTPPRVVSPEKEKSTPPRAVSPEKEKSRIQETPRTSFLSPVMSHGAPMINSSLNPYSPIFSPQAQTIRSLSENEVTVTNGSFLVRLSSAPPLACLREEIIPETSIIKETPIIEPEREKRTRTRTGLRSDATRKN